MDILHKDNITIETQTGFRQQRLIVDSTLTDQTDNDNYWQGLGNFVYLADMEFNPNGETKNHRQYDMDIISFMLTGKLKHQGPSGKEQLNTDYDVIIQRVGNEGCQLRATNPDSYCNRILQMKILPERQGNPSKCKTFHPQHEQLTRVYGGNRAQNIPFPAKTLVDVALLSPKQYLSINEDFMAYLSIGSAIINNKDCQAGTLLKGQQLKLEALEDCHIVIIRLAAEL